MSFAPTRTRSHGLLSLVAIVLYTAVYLLRNLSSIRLDAGAKTYAAAADANVVSAQNRTAAPPFAGSSIGGVDDVPSSVRPLLFAAGQGTTATHAMMEATCIMGLQSVHHAIRCTRDPETNDIRRGLEAHNRAVATYKSIWECSLPKKNCTFSRLTYLVDKVKNETTTVITSGIDALHDTPYPFLLNHVLETGQAERGRVHLALSERDPKRWAERRLGHPNSVFCKEFVDPDRQTRHEYGALDIGHCLSLAMRRNPLPRLGSEVFTTIGKLNRSTKKNETRHERVIHLIEIAMEQYQARVHELGAIYSINVWERPERVNTTDLAEEMEQALVKTGFRLPRERNLDPYKDRKGFYKKVERRLFSVASW